MAKNTEEVRYHNFTFKISIDFILRGIFAKSGVTDRKQQLQLLTQNDNENRKKEYKEVLRAFWNFCEGFGVEKAACILHNKDFHKEKKTKKLIPDDWHMHFIAWCDRNKKATESAWRRRLAKYGLKLTDESRVKNAKTKKQAEKMKDIQKLDKKNEGNAFAYLIHRTPKAIKDGKHAYDQDAILTYNMTQQDIQELLIKGGVPKEYAEKSITLVQFYDDKTATEELKKDSAKVSDFLTAMQDKINEIDKDARQVLNDQFDATMSAFADEIRHGATIEDVKERSEKYLGVYHSLFWKRNHKYLEEERDEYVKRLVQQLPYRDRHFSLFYISGRGGVGKSLIANQLAYLLADEKTHSIHSASPKGKNKTFDLMSNYNNELVTVAHEMNPSAMGVDEFENIAEPHRYPNVNSRNKDKAYFVQALIITKSMLYEEWAYRMVFTDYMKFGRNSGRYGYKPTINKNGGEETLYFPSTYDGFLQAFDRFASDQPSPYFDHWSARGENLFFNDIWQILRRMPYILHIEADSASYPDAPHPITINVMKLLGNPMIPVNNNHDFVYNANFGNFYTGADHYHIKNFLDNAEVQGVLKQILKDFKKNGLIIEPNLPKLLSDEELKKVIGDDGESLYTKKQKVVENTGNKVNDATIDNENSTSILPF